MRISDWSSDVCSSDLAGILHDRPVPARLGTAPGGFRFRSDTAAATAAHSNRPNGLAMALKPWKERLTEVWERRPKPVGDAVSFLVYVLRRFNSDDGLMVASSLTYTSLLRSEAHTSELQSLLHNPY